MYELLSHSGLATVALDYANAFWPLGVVLFVLNRTARHWDTI